MDIMCDLQKLSEFQFDSTNINKLKFEPLQLTLRLYSLKITLKQLSTNTFWLASLTIRDNQGLLLNKLWIFLFT